MEEIYGKVYTSDSLLETVLYWGINCTCDTILIFTTAVRVNVGTFGHSRVQLLLGTRHVVQYNVSNDI